MFHIHIIGALNDPWLGPYTGNDYSNETMGKWFTLYKKHTKIFICFINHPVYPV